MRRYIFGILIVHLGVSVLVLSKAGIQSVFPPFSEIYAYQIFSDVAASLALVLLLLGYELKRKNKSLKPLIGVAIGIVFLGSFSPLIYLLIERDLFKTPSP